MIQNPSKGRIFKGQSVMCARALINYELTASLVAKRFDTGKLV